MRNYSLLISKKIYARNIFVFFLFAAVFFAYHSSIQYNNPGMFIFSHAIVLLVFFLTAFRAKLGFYLFIFLIPLINIVPNIMEIRDKDILLYLFFGFFLGFLLSFFEKDFKNRLSFLPRNYYDKQILVVCLVFLGMLIISAAITVFRFANFYPLITNHYYNLEVNLFGFTSDNAIPWVIRHFFNYAIGFLFLFSAFNIIGRRKDIIRAIIVLISATGLASVFATYQYFFNPTLGSSQEWAGAGRINSTFTDPNSLGAFCIIVFPIFFSLVLFTKRLKIKLIFSVLFVFFMLMLFFSGSRIALLVVFLALLVFAVYGLIRYIKYLSSAPARKKIINLAIVLPLIFILAASSTIIFFTDNQLKDGFMQSDVFQRTARSLDTFRYHFEELGIVEGLKSISNFRYFYWDMAINMARDYPATGVGVGAYVVELPDYLYRLGTGFFIVDHTGNYYLQVLSELGIFGLLAILFLFYLIIRKTSLYYSFKRKAGFKKKDDRLLFGLFTAFAITLASLMLGTHTNFTEIQLTFWLAAAFILSYIKINQVGMAQRLEELDDIGKAEQTARPLALAGSINLGWIQKTSLAVALAVFLAGFMAASYTTLSVNVKQTVEYSMYEYSNEFGFYEEVEADGMVYQWTAIDASKVVQKEGNTMVIPMRAANPDIEEEPLGVRVYADNSLMGSLWFEDDSWYDVIVDLSHINRDRFTLTITCSRDWVQRDWGVGSSRKELGVMLGRWYFE